MGWADRFARVRELAASGASTPAAQAELQGHATVLHAATSAALARYKVDVEDRYASNDKSVSDEFRDERRLMLRDLLEALEATGTALNEAETNALVDHRDKPALIALYDAYNVAARASEFLAPEDMGRMQRLRLSVYTRLDQLSRLPGYKFTGIEQLLLVGLRAELIREHLSNGTLPPRLLPVEGKAYPEYTFAREWLDAGHPIPIDVLATRPAVVALWEQSQGRARRTEQARYDFLGVVLCDRAVVEEPCFVAYNVETESNNAKKDSPRPFDALTFKTTDALRARFEGWRVAQTAAGTLPVTGLWDAFRRAAAIPGISNTAVGVSQALIGNDVWAFAVEAWQDLHAADSTATLWHHPLVAEAPQTPAAIKQQRADLRQKQIDRKAVEKGRVVFDVLRQQAESRRGNGFFAVPDAQPVVENLGLVQGYLAMYDRRFRTKVLISLDGFNDDGSLRPNIVAGAVYCAGMGTEGSSIDAMIDWKNKDRSIPGFEVEQPKVGDEGVVKGSQKLTPLSLRIALDHAGHGKGPNVSVFSGPDGHKRYLEFIERFRAEYRSWFDPTGRQFAFWALSGRSTGGQIPWQLNAPGYSSGAWATRHGPYALDYILRQSKDDPKFRFNWPGITMLSRWEGMIPDWMYRLVDRLNEGRPMNGVELVWNILPEYLADRVHSGETLSVVLRGVLGDEASSASLLARLDAGGSISADDFDPAEDSALLQSEYRDGSDDDRVQLGHHIRLNTTILEHEVIPIYADPVRSAAQIADSGWTFHRVADRNIPAMRGLGVSFEDPVTHEELSFDDVLEMDFLPLQQAGYRGLYLAGYFRGVAKELARLAGTWTKGDPAPSIEVSLTAIRAALEQAKALNVGFKDPLTLKTLGLPQALALWEEAVQLGQRWQAIQDYFAALREQMYAKHQGMRRDEKARRLNMWGKLDEEYPFAILGDQMSFPWQLEGRPVRIPEAQFFWQAMFAASGQETLINAGAGHDPRNHSRVKDRDLPSARKRAGLPPDHPEYLPPMPEGFTEVHVLEQVDYHVGEYLKELLAEGMAAWNAAHAESGLRLVRT